MDLEGIQLNRVIFTITGTKEIVKIERMGNETCLLPRVPKLHEMHLNPDAQLVEFTRIQSISMKKKRIHAL